ncbi:transferase [Aphanothece sacrum]|uniref:Carbon dioxide concentrating mechanism protein n=1 Tax=Aphanothece sacrum FPU1 TaxID=1920663 RepID=A0A401IDG2_APHSA|nr:transferase [Aphanothece sacrum]GBF79292.1 carbon dioxide concentrating mechanism protein [Aphanothece sacrum FPU1]GBF86795.1 carbon dioxide concentrating mechanism protein [Aphanothece sacrum FPU3]
MRLPLVYPPTQLDICVIGDVTIHDGAVVAPGTILQAAPNSRIVIREGACIGMGTLLNAYEGDIEIESGAMLGAGVLVVGHSKIGKNACIGSSSTILNTSIAPGTAIEAGSLIGDMSRRPVSSEISEPSQAIKSETNGSVAATNGSILDSNDVIPKPETTEVEKPEFVEEMEDLWLEPETEVEEIPEIINPPNIPNEMPNVPVVGQIYINQLLCTLFPERQAFNRSQNNSSS